MNCSAFQQLSALGGNEERRMMKVDPMVCPKPRRLPLSNPSFYDHITPLSFPINNQVENGDSKAGAELLDLILTKGGYGTERSGYQVASSPPFYCGSPPSRASNPVVQDAQFGSGKMIPLSPAPPSPSSSSSARKGGCVRMPAAMRIEGFDCLSRDSRNCSISAMA